MTWLRRHRSSQNELSRITWDELLQKFCPGTRVRLESVWYFVTSSYRLHGEAGSIWIITFQAVDGRACWLEIPESHDSLHVLCWTFVDYAGSMEQAARTLTVTGITAEPSAFYAVSDSHVRYVSNRGKVGWYMTTRYRSAEEPCYEISIECYDYGDMTMNVARPISIQDIVVFDRNDRN